jgi:hypothetical protein
MVYFQEYLAQVGERQKRVGIVGEEHGLCNERESALASELVDKYSMIALEGTTENENYPLYEILADFVSHYFVYPFVKFAIGGHKCFDHYIQERNKHVVYLEEDRSSHFRQDDRSYKIDELKSILLAPLIIPIAFFSGIYHRRTPAVEKPERPTYFPPGTKERDMKIALSLLKLLKDPSIEDVLAIVGKDHFLGIMDELKNQEVELTKIS